MTYAPTWLLLAILVLSMTATGMAVHGVHWLRDQPGPGRHAATLAPVVYAEVTSPDLPRLDLDPERWPLVDAWPDWDEDTLTGLRVPVEWGPRLAEVDEPGAADTVLMRADSQTLATLARLQELDPETAVFYERIALEMAGAR